VLTQHVAHRGAAYPVVADPTVGLGWQIYVTYNRDESYAIGTSSVTTKYKLASVVCLAIPNPVAAAGCALYIYDSWESVANTFITAAGRMCEVEMRYAYQGLLTGWNTKNCLK
jgi:hypothetical protein